MSTTTRENEIYHLEEGHLCVDFVNTAYIQVDEAAPFGYIPTEERLVDLPALGVWGLEIGLFRQSDVDILNQPPATGSALRLTELQNLREALRQIIRAHHSDQPVPETSMAVVNQTVAPFLASTRLVPFDHGFRTAMSLEHATTADQLLDYTFWAIGQSTINLLTDHRELEMIVDCPADDCGYLFRDTSHGRRRWCSMKSCGNRAKVQRFRERQKISA